MRVGGGGGPGVARGGQWQGPGVFMFGRPPHALSAQVRQLPNGTFPARSGSTGTPEAARVSAVGRCSRRMSVGWVMLETSSSLDCWIGGGPGSWRKGAAVVVRGSGQAACWPGRSLPSAVRCRAPLAVRVLISRETVPLLRPVASATSFAVRAPDCTAASTLSRLDAAPDGAAVSLTRCSGARDCPPGSARGSRSTWAGRGRPCRRGSRCGACAARSP